LEQFQSLFLDEKYEKYTDNKLEKSFLENIIVRCT